MDLKFVNKSEYPVYIGYWIYKDGLLCHEYMDAKPSKVVDIPLSKTEEWYIVSVEYERLAKFRLKSKHPSFCSTGVTFEQVNDNEILWK